MAINKGIVGIGESSTPVVPSDNFDAVLYTGGSQATVSLSFEPDFIWLKSRGGSYGHMLFDSVRGIDLPNDYYLQSNTTAAQITHTNRFTLNGNSMTIPVGSNSINSSNGSPYVIWYWKAGGAAVSNTDGTITSQVSANVDAGFSIVKYTGNGNTAQQSYGHGLSSAPELLITKNMDTLTLGTSSWVVGGTLLGNGGYMLLNRTNAKNTASSYNGNEVPDSEVIYTSGTSDLVGNQNNKNFITYAFHSVDGFSKIGTYVGNGSTTGPIINTGFTPAWIMFKPTTATGYWFILDNKRSTTNPRNEGLFPNDLLNEITNTSYNVDFNSNGFQPKNNTIGFNQNGQTYIFMAFAE